MNPVHVLSKRTYERLGELIGFGSHSKECRTRWIPCLEQLSWCTCTWFRRVQPFRRPSTFSVHEMPPILSWYSVVGFVADTADLLEECAYPSNLSYTRRKSKTFCFLHRECHCSLHLGGPNGGGAVYRNDYAWPCDHPRAWDLLPSFKQAWTWPPCTFASPICIWPTQELENFYLLVNKLVFCSTNERTKQMFHHLPINWSRIWSNLGYHSCRRNIWTSASRKEQEGT